MKAPGVSSVSRAGNIRLAQPTAGSAAHSFAAPRAAAAFGREPGAAATSPAEVARLLAGVRTALGYSEIELAIRLATTPRVVFALENGWFEALPEWAETRRIVDGWVTAAGLDPRPALEALARAIHPVGEAGQTAAARRAPISPVPAARDSSPDSSATRSTASRGLVQRLPRPLRRQATVPVQMPANMFEEGEEGGIADRGAPQPHARVRLPRPKLLPLPKLPASRLARLGALVIMAVGLWVTTTQTAVVAAAVATLPAPAERAVRSISDFLAVRFAPLREGHRWISVDDPRSRRGDKLRIGRRSD